MQLALMIALGAAWACQRTGHEVTPAQSVPTTDGKIALDNLNGQIEAVEKALLRNPGHAQLLGTLVTLLQTRGQFLGRLADYERAEQLASQLPNLAPADAQSYLARAATRSTFHQFDDALADLAEAEQLGAPAEAITRGRASIFQAQGRISEAEPLWKKISDRGPDIIALGSIAMAASEKGDPSGGEKLLNRALREYRDVSPFPVAWIEFQRGVMWERAGNLSRAEDEYRRAHLRLPQYAAAAGHLAEALIAEGRRSEANALLEPLIKASDDPEYLALLAEIRKAEGNLPEATRLRALARERYEQLLSRHRAAFADHAAQFWLGENPKKALALSLDNLAVRTTAEAYETALSSALAAKEPRLACNLAEKAARLPRVTGTLKPLLERVSVSCGSGGTQAKRN